MSEQLNSNEEPKIHSLEGYHDKYFTEVFISMARKKSSFERDREVYEKIGQASWIGTGTEFFIALHQRFENPHVPDWKWTALATGITFIAGIFFSFFARILRYELVKIDRVAKVFESNKDGAVDLNQIIKDYKPNP